jgi:2-keto-4-pentenoate hydratase/2-oxohepta-3-ene-1,7-dioic acid hydratase in catechol pathway
VKIARVQHGGTISFAVIEGDTAARLEGPPIGAIRFSGDRVPLNESRLLAPTLPSKVIGVSGNFPENATDPSDEAPVLFLKPSTSVIGPLDAIRTPLNVGPAHYEPELAVVVSGLVRHADEETAARSILGYTCANDVTARDIQVSDGQWARAKGFDSFCPLGPWIETDLDASDLLIQGRLNGEVVQEGRTSAMRFSPAALVSYVSRIMTLLPGDVILCGTPGAPGPMHPFDGFEVDIQGIGILQNPIE